MSLAPQLFLCKQRLIVEIPVSFLNFKLNYKCFLNCIRYMGTPFVVI